ncbi:hypothetical protein SPRG_22236 [Saprolegnia parasitica CBS 223.65]|uniref:DDE Tnp4 domain-containing protein n=1 Tax=Saprolegnia parasitica (strain CBS 223.65) TaxID=695850 RepID=A0A067C495_SAPPC|nr:hypothetical protein SPRG_22236 [Saprolegnia parasitica CBS 223.65]KDO25333.1 hypothetical protein SPRG_22236 [Saprolegnia parasitica CBS 223.65]|eukprot:XP_012204029.1 hypothetical protein SPRG_22236 [Saprolegnia parasitica CBS 223.65]
MTLASLWHNSVVRLLLLGTLDDGSSLHGLRGQSDILKAIVDHLHAIWRAQLKADQRGYVLGGIRLLPGDIDRDEVLRHNSLLVDFPPPLTHLVDGVEQPKPFLINMMPFVIGHAERRSHTIGSIGYFTIHEDIVEADTSQRRPGLHVEAPSAAKLQNYLGAGEAQHKWAEIRWGQGWTIYHELQGGIYMASTVANSCGVWNTVVADENDIVGAHGDVDVLHGVLDRERDDYYEPQANELYWITDRTPHESLPVTETQFQQYFRFVTSNISHWFAEHSTPNPLGIQPTAAIVYGNKFTGTLMTEVSLVEALVMA